MENIGIGQNNVIENLRRVVNGYQFNLRGTSIVITVNLKEIKKTGKFVFKQSHFIHTPVQAGPYETGHSWGNGEKETLDNALRTFTMFYGDAVIAGHKPNDSWLIFNEKY
jgi:hypothetical protein